MSRPGPSEVLKRLPESSAALTKRVLEAADEGGLAVYLVGGPVRDLLLGRSVRDVDLVVEPMDGQGAESLARAAATDAGRVVVHDRFGTVRIDGPEASLDLTTVRSETYDHDGALPSVVSGRIEDDLRRRDFSVNALALPLSRVARVRRAGIVDVGGGLDDLREGRLRVLHPRSFHDDPTRALRAARLSPRLGFSLTRGSRTALRNALRDGAFSRVSGDRYRRELVKLFDDASHGLDPARALRLLDEWHVLAALEPGLAFPREAGAPERRVGRAVATPPWRAPRWRPWATGLMVWLAPLSPALRRRALRRFAVRGALADRIAAIPRQRERILRSVERARGRGAIDALLRDLPEEELHAVYAWAEPAIRRRIARFAGEDRLQRPPVTGADLTARGLAGPDVGRALARIRVAFLDGALSTSEEALGLAEEVMRRGKRRK